MILNWHAQLAQALAGKHWLVLTVGEAQHGDLGFGPALAGTLAGVVQFPLVNGGAAPENYLGVVEAALPEVVLVISAIELGLPAGEIRLLEVQDLAGIASPQGARLQALCRHFEQCCETQVLSLGVQPANPSGARLSPQAAQAMEQVSAALQSLPVAASDPQWVDRFNEMGLFFES